MHRIKRYIRKIIKYLYDLIFNRPIGYVFMFHRVAPADNALTTIDDLRVSIEYFRHFLLEKQNSFIFVNMDEAVKIINRQQKIKHPFCVITFDDGYEDNYIYAYPILKELGVPFTIYVSVNFINNHQPIWNYPIIIERIIRNNDELVLANGMRFVCKTIDEKNETFLQLKAWLFSLPYVSIHKEFIHVLGRYFTDDVFAGYRMLSWKQLQEMVNDPLCTIGSHTMSHCRLVMDDETSLIYELQNSKNVLSKKLGVPIKHLSYPFGWINDVSNEAINVAKRVGYKTGLRSFGGAVRKKDKDLFNIKRIMVKEYE